MRQIYQQFQFGDAGNFVIAEQIADQEFTLIFRDIVRRVATPDEVIGE